MLPPRRFGRLAAVKRRRTAAEAGRDGATVRLSLDTEGSGASEETDGLVGGEVLHRFKLILDYSRKRMILEPNDSPGGSK